MKIVRDLLGSLFIKFVWMALSASFGIVFVQNGAGLTQDQITQIIQAQSLTLILVVFIGALVWVVMDQALVWINWMLEMAELTKKASDLVASVRKDNDPTNK